MKLVVTETGVAGLTHPALWVAENENSIRKVANFDSDYDFDLFLKAMREEGFTVSEKDEERQNEV